MKANQCLNKNHNYLLNYTEKVWKKSKKLEKARKCPGPTRPAPRIVKPDPTRARISKTRPDPSPQKSGSKPSLGAGGGGLPRKDGKDSYNSHFSHKTSARKRRVVRSRANNWRGCETRQTSRSHRIF